MVSTHFSPPPARPELIIILVKKKRPFPFSRPSHGPNVIIRLKKNGGILHLLYFLQSRPKNEGNVVPQAHQGGEMKAIARRRCTKGGGNKEMTRRRRAKAEIEGKACRRHTFPDIVYMFY